MIQSGLIAACLALLAVIAVQTVRLGHAQTDAATAHTALVTLQRDSAQAIVDAQAKAAEVNTRVVTKYVDRVKVVREKGDTIIKRIPVYVTQKSDARCVVPAGFVRVHDSAAQGDELPVAAGSAAETPSGIALSTVADTVAGNYQLCHGIAERLTALQQWAVDQSRAGQ